MTTDLTARVAEMAAAIKAHLAKDQATAEEATKVSMSSWAAVNSLLLVRDAEGTFSVDIAEVTDYRYDAVLIHAARHDPARAFRRVKAVRDLVAEILAERHLYVDGDPWFSCSQATEPGEEDEPGSACADDERRGKPCDCGRDMRVARLLGIIASEWEG